ncbi:MAG: type II toxin-antitoxin system HicB family antitoxin [Phycisphaerae bacterium]
MMRSVMTYTVLIARGNERGYVATVPVLPGCVSQGRTKRDALKNIKEAIEVYVEALLEDGLAVPVEAGKELVEVEVSAR